MATGVRTKYNVAINSKGYILRGTPANPAYSRAVVATQIDRLAISDVQYSDFSGSGLFYVAQTDWSAGVKNEKLWRDDAKFYYSTNIDAYSEQGVIKLEKELETFNDFTENLVCGGSFTAGGTTSEYVGTTDNASNYPLVYKYNGSSWSDVATTTFGTNKNVVSQLISHRNNVYAAIVGTGNTYSLGKYTGASWSDLTAAAITAITAGSGGSNLASCRCLESIGSTLYVGGDDFVNDKTFILSTDDEGANFTLEVLLKTDGVIVSMKNYAGKLYYLLSESNTLMLRVFDPATNSDTEVAGGLFYGVSFTGGTQAGRSNFLRVYGGKLIITVPLTRIYEFDGSNLTLIFRRDENKNTIGREASCELSYGAIEVDDRLIWGNLVYDGEAFFNHKKPNGDTTANYLVPLYANDSAEPRYFSGADLSILLKNLSTYKSTLDSNFLVMSEMSQISKIDKLLYSLTLLFDPLTTGQQIKVQYSIDNMSNWTTLDTLTPSTEGTNSKKEIFLSTNVIYNKIWWKVFLDGASTTPKLLDFIVAYKPMPDYKNRWTMQLEMAERFKLLNGQYEQRDPTDLIAELWMERINKRKVLFEDIDYVQCSLTSAMTSGATSALVDGTRLFPRQGRMRIVSGGVAEEITYTSAESNKLKGITRALRGTKARAYASGQLIKNDFDVYIDNVSTRLNFTDQEKTEGIVQVSLTEA